MPIIITQGRFTQDAIKGILAKPEDREPALRHLAGKQGGKIVSCYMIFGEHGAAVASFKAPGR